MSVYITGDCHGEFKKLNTERFSEQYQMTRDDIVIITGDFGGISAKDENSKGKGGWKDEQNKLMILEGRSFTTAFIDGNHENYDRLYRFPVREWNGGKVHEVRPHILHLMRGQVFTIEGMTYFTFGGASSQDISDGILDPEIDPNWKKTLKWKRSIDEGRVRIKGLDWWPQESFHYMNPEEIRAQKEEAYRNLDRVGWKVNYVITHELPASIRTQYKLGCSDPDEHSLFLEEIHSRLEYDHWYAGHFHRDVKITDKDEIVYNEVNRILP